MNPDCRIQFTKKFIDDHLGKQFFKQVVKPAQLTEYMVSDRALFPIMDPLLNWYREIDDRKNAARYGGASLRNHERPNIRGERGKRSSNMAKVVVNRINCPNNTCRGVVDIHKTNPSCTICFAHICPTCREIKTAAEHTCDPNILENVKALANDQAVRPCPKCGLSIYRTHGCNHMKCTVCETHFDWETLEILTYSSNGHYTNVQRMSVKLLGENSAMNKVESTLSTIDDVAIPDELSNTHVITIIPVKQFVSANPNDTTPECNARQDDIRMRALLEPYANQLDPVFYKSLLIVSNSVRVAYTTVFEESHILYEAQEALDNNRIQYMLNRRTEKKWGEMIYSIMKRRESRLLIYGILNLYLSLVDRLQRKTLRLCQQNGHDDEVKAKIATFTELYGASLKGMIQTCNENLAAICDEYDLSEQIKIRAYDESNPDVPNFMM